MPLSSKQLRWLRIRSRQLERQTPLRALSRGGLGKRDVRRLAAMNITIRDKRSTQVPPQLAATLRLYGLQSLERWAGEALATGKSQEQIALELFERPEFIERFPAINARQRAGLPSISVDDYLGFESTVTSLGSTWGLQLSKGEIDNLLINDVSAQEVEQRFTMAATAVFESSAETRQMLGQLHGVNMGDMMRYFMNPKEQLPILQNRLRTAEIAGAALRTGYGKIDETAATRLREAGFGEEEAMEGFSTLARMKRPLFSPIRFGEEEIGAETQLSFLAGDVEAARRIEQRARQRVAEFEGRPGFVAGQEGFTTGVAVRQ